MYNLQTAKEEIEQVAKHTSALTEFVMSLGERVQAHEHLDAKLNDFKTTLMKEIETKFADLERKIFGSETAHQGTSAVSELGQKVAGLLHIGAPSPASDEHHSDQHHHDPRHG